MLYDEESIRLGDELLGPVVTADILRKAEEWLYVLAVRLGVAKEDIVPGFLVQNLIAAYAYREACYLKSYGSKTGGAVWREQSNSDTDYYGQKLRYYELRIKDLEKQITAADLTGNKPGAQGYRAVTIYRG